MMDDTLLNDFLAECREHLEGIETDLLAIEETGKNADPDLVNKVFRAAHSIKGGAGFFNLANIKNLAHRIETVLDLIRSHTLLPEAEAVNILLVAFDQLRVMVNNPDEQGTIDSTANIASLEELADRNLSGAQKEALKKITTMKSSDGKRTAAIPSVDIEAARKNAQYIYLIEYDLLHDIERKGKSPVVLLNSLSSMGVIIDAFIDIASIGTLDDEPSGVVPVNLIYRTVAEPDLMETAVEVDAEQIHLLFKPGSPANSDPVAAENCRAEAVGEPAGDCRQVAQSGVAAPPSGERESPSNITATGTAPTVRVNVNALDALMSQAGELVLGRNQLLDAVVREDARAIKLSAQRISFITSELQEAVMRTRLQPVGNIFGKFTRIVHDMAASLQKEIKLRLEGKEVELDKTIVEGLSDPLTHMIRNSADHGIESPDDRRRSGKVAAGTISLRAFHEAGQVTIEIADDGKGIDTARVAAKALSMGLITQEKLSAMTENEKMELIFLPGLSTAGTVTDTSGRGVGMDVVKTNLDRLGGKMEIRSRTGEGTTFRIKLPLTLAIIPSLIIRENGERYAIPQVNVVELVRIPAAQAKERIQLVGEAEVLVLRGAVIPLVRFSNLLGSIDTYVDPETGNAEIDRRVRLADRRSPRMTPDGYPDKSNHPSQEIIQSRNPADRRYHADSDVNIVILTAGNLHYGLTVDEMCNSEEIVVKPLGRHLKGLQEYAGATIMGDGEVALILDAIGMALKAAVGATAVPGSSEKSAEAADGGLTLLRMNTRQKEPCALPLNIVQRVERIDPAEIEVRGGRRTMQYRGTSLPLVELSDAVGGTLVSGDGEVAVAVSSIAGRDIGFLGYMPVSVVEIHDQPDTSIHRNKGISGSAIINGTTILMIDLGEIVNEVFPEWNLVAAQASIASVSPLGAPCIVLAEDSDFFREQVGKIIQECGFRVMAAKDGQHAWEIIDANADLVTAVVTDIEMPRLDGFGLCRKIREDRRFDALPVIALTSLAGEEDAKMATSAGISEYLIKLDRDMLVASLSTIFHGSGARRPVEQTR